MDIGCYPIKTSRMVFGEEPTRVTGAFVPDPDFGVDILASAILDYPSGQCVFACSTQVVPHQSMQFFGTTGRVELEVEEFKEREEKNLVFIKATIQVERESQKGILIGEKGRRLKEIGSLAREEIEALLGTKVFLELWVKVEKNWREDPAALRRLGYQ